jgi:adenine-specific DNA-methyltransferase
MLEPKIKNANIATSDITQERLQTLKGLFPDLFDHEGNLDEAALKALVNPNTQTTERFRFEWAGKQESKRFAFKPSRATLIADKDRSIDFDTTQNMIIEGDNLEVLKLLRQTYFEKIKCIYIDPPYNTGHDFIYPDNFADGKKAYWQKNGTTQNGVKLQALSESSGRKHSNWLNMMQSRLLLAQQLLREDGVIFISIDDNEQANLKKLCDEIFGEENFVSNIIWEKRYGRSNNAKLMTNSTEHILFYRKSSSVSTLRESRLENHEGGYSNPDNDERGVWTSVSFVNQVTREARQNLSYTIINPNTGEKINHPTNAWKVSEEKYQSLLAENRLHWGADGKAKYPRIKRFLSELDSGMTPVNFWKFKEAGTVDLGTKEIKELMNTSVFTFPKPTLLIKKMLSLFNPDKPSTESNDIILDFFAGSGTTAHAVMQLNAEDGGNRQYICVQIPEYTDEETEAFQAGYKTISQLCIERVKRAGNKIKAENLDKVPNKILDTGFRVYKLTDSHFPENLFTSDPEKSEADNLAALEEHLKQASQKTLFDKNNLANIITEISLKNGYGLFFSLETLNKFDKNTVYRLAGNDKSTLICLDDSVHENTVDSLIDKYVREHLIISKHAVDTAKKWLLHNAFTDNMQVV